MGWLISIPMLLFGCFNNNNILVITSGLFAIAGSISFATTNVVQAIQTVKSQQKE